MKIRLIILFFYSLSQSLAQSTESAFDISKLDVVLTHPDMDRVTVQKDLVYLNDVKGHLHTDIYFPPALKANETRPAIVFLNGTGGSELRNTGIYTSWAKLVAAHGFIGVTMDSNPQIDTCFNALFAFLEKEQNRLHIDAKSIGVYASSANGRAASAWLMGPQAYKGIKAATLYYGEVPRGPYKRDLPVLFVVAEADIPSFGYSHLWTEVLKNKSPWTIVLGTELLHGFDSFVDTDDARRVIRQTIDFWKNHLTSVPPSSGKNVRVRDVVSAQYAGDHKKVIRLLKEWFQANPASKDAPALRLLASSLMREGSYQEAEIAYNKSLAIDPQNRGSFLNMVVISYALDKRAEAEKYLAWYEKGEKPEAFTYGYVGRFLMGLGKYTDAEAYFKRSVELGPHPSDHYNLGLCYARKGQADLAFQHLFNALDLGFKNRQPYDAEDLSVLRTDKRWNDVLKRLE